MAAPGEKEASNKAIAEKYFDGLRRKDLSGVPWSVNAALRTPLNPNGGSASPIVGREAIKEFFSPMLPALGSVKVVRVFTGGDWAVAFALIGLANGAELRVCDQFRLVHGEIVEQENCFDPRPALG